MGQSKRGSPEPLDAAQPLEWTEIANLIDVRADGSWQMTDFAKAWFNTNTPTATTDSCEPEINGANQRAVLYLHLVV